MNKVEWSYDKDVKKKNLCLFIMYVYNSASKIEICKQNISVLPVLRLRKIT